VFEKLLKKRGELYRNNCIGNFLWNWKEKTDRLEGEVIHGTFFKGTYQEFLWKW
jgi:hypothetical protein